MTTSQQRVAAYKGRVFKAQVRFCYGGAVLPPVPEYDDVQSVGVLDAVHPYLVCMCATRLAEGTSADGAAVLVCMGCHRVVDERRVA